MSERYIKLCREAIALRAEAGRAFGQPHRVGERTFVTLGARAEEAESAVWSAHPPELLLALWECPRYFNGQCVGCFIYQDQPRGIGRHHKDCPVRRVEELTKE